MDNTETGSLSRPSLIHGPSLQEEMGSRAQTIAAFAREITSRHADREALVIHDARGEVRWNYRDLWDQSVAIARALIAGGVSRETRVGILMTNRPDYVAAIFGTALAGGVVVPLSTFATGPELAQMLDVSCVHTLLFEPQLAGRDFAETLIELEPGISRAKPGQLTSIQFPFLRRLAAVTPTLPARPAAAESWSDFLASGEAVAMAEVEARAATSTPSDTAVLFFSSGSTGIPKGILQNQRAVAIQWWRWPRTMGFSGDLRVWTANGFFWSGQFAMSIGSALSTGGTLVLQSAFNPDEALELIEKERVNVPFAMPHQWGRIGGAAGFQQADLSSLTFVDLAFTGLSQPTLRSDYRTPQAFGCTETLTINTQIPLDASGDHPFEGNGLPLPGNTLKIIDPLTGEIVPRGTRGEIAIKGPTLMMRYLGKNAEECFDSEGYFHTGDGGYVDDSGWLYWEGRLNDIIKTGGANVSPVEVDELIQTYPGIKATQTVGVPHDTLGEMVVACIVPFDDAIIDEEDLQQFLRQHLASYKLPRKVLFLKEEELSVTGSGNKIKAGQVRELAIARLGSAPPATGSEG